MNNGEGHPDHHPEKNHKNHQKEAGEKTQKQKEGEQMSRPAVEVLGVIDAENNVDIDRLYQATAPMFADGQ